MIQNTNVGVALFVCAYVHSLFLSSVSEILQHTHTPFQVQYLVTFGLRKKHIYD